MSERLNHAMAEIHWRSLRHVLLRACLVAFSVAAVDADSHAQAQWHNLEAGDYGVGFRLFQEEDLARVVQGDTSRPRPVRIYLWYPAAQSSGQPIRLGRYAELAEDDVWPDEIVVGLRDRLSFSQRPLARSLGPEGFRALLEQSVRARENAEALAGPFPLIVLGQGLYYESPIAQAALSEYLAGRGFVVATSPLVGTHSPLVRVDVEDLETQVRDLEFLIARTRRLDNVSADRLGVVGFDMGGMAGLILAMRNTDVDAFVSMDAGVLGGHPSGIPAALPAHDPLALRIPWLHAAQRALGTPDGDYESLFDTAVHSERYLWLSDEMRHVDFTSYALVEDRQEMASYWLAWEPRAVRLHQTLAQYVWHFFAAFLMQEPESLVFLEQDTERVAPGSTITLEHRTPVTSPLTYAEFVNELITGDPAEAVAKVRSLQDTHPSHILLSDTYLRRLTVSLLFTWGLEAAAREVIDLGLELKPDNTWGRAYLGWLERERRTRG